jgi:hypothetical protein
MDQAEELITELELMRETNRRLNRRCQMLESVIANKQEANYWACLRYKAGYAEGLLGNQEVQKWQRVAQKHGEKNAKLKQQIARLLLDISQLCTRY